ncbi:hypothetical protein [Candidatus Uabimicrobium sp. HlEnr_7]|uniref:hypothetical protein n=1 Tax=Candidatus Uabimicrobium helgolandensis TaxID=3095367 RepID=UPI00355760C4
MKIKAKYLSTLRYFCYNHRRTWEMKKEISQSLQEKNCIINNKAIPISMMPVLLTQQEKNNIASIAQETGKLVNKTVEACFASPRMKDYLSTEILPEQWVQRREGSLLQRIDIVYNGNDYKVIGVECDAPRGQSWTDYVRISFANHSYYKKFIEFPELENKLYLLESLISELQKINTAPTVALVDFRESSSITDLQIASRFLTHNGIKAFIADPRDFQFKNGKAYVNDACVDIVIRGCSTKNLIQNADQISNFIEAYNNKSFVAINSLFGAYGSDKSLFSLMTNDDFSDIYDKQQKQFIQKYIPWTRRFSEQQTFYGKNAIELKEFTKEYREGLVLKPANGDSTHMVQMGIAMEQPRWEGMVNNYHGRSDWIVQKYVDLPFVFQPNLIKGKVSKEKRYFCFSAFVLNQKFQTLLCRCSPDPAIHMDKGTVMPIFTYEKTVRNKKTYIR